MRRRDKIFPIIFVGGISGSVMFTFTYIFLTQGSQPSSQITPEGTLWGAIYIGLMGLIGLSFGVALFLPGLRNMKKKKLMQSLPTSKIRSLAIGITEIYGKVVPGKSGIMKSPFANHDCVGVKIIIEEYQNGGENPPWVEVEKLVRGIEFFLQDDTGMVLVDLRGAELDIPVSNVFALDSRAGPPPNFLNFLRKYNINLGRHGYRTSSQRIKHFLRSDYEGALGRNNPMRYSESIIRPGDQLYVLGRADNYPKFREGGAQHGVQDLMMQQSHNPNIYFISARSEKQILEKKNYKSIAQIFGGLLLIGGSLFLIALNFELILSLMMVLGINR